MNTNDQTVFLNTSQNLVERRAKQQMGRSVPIQSGQMRRDSAKTRSDRVKLHLFQLVVVWPVHEVVGSEQPEGHRLECKNASL